MPDQPQPRRRITDKDRRLWSDARLSDRQATVDRRLDTLEEFQRVMAQVPGLMNGLQEQLEETQKDVREMRARMDKNFDRNFAEHREVKATADEIAAEASKIAQTVKPGRLDWAMKVATIVSFLLIPILAAWVATGGTH